MPEAAARNAVGGDDSPDAAADRQAARVETLMKLIPLQRAPLAES